MKLGLFKPTLGRKNKKKIFGFDIETYNKNRSFYCASIVGDNLVRTFYDKKELINFFKSNIFRNSIVAATNLRFDFYGTFHKQDEVQEFFPCWRGSHLIFCKTFISDGEFSIKRKKKNDKSLTFIDTLNYAKLSVKQIGNILNIPKIKNPSFLGEKPKDDNEKMEMTAYNIQDAKISKEFIEFLFKSFEKLGATPKNTIAATSMSLFKNRYLNDIYWRHNVNYLLDEFNAYYGGRVEAFKRGFIEDYNYYDINSLYPSVMCNEYPNPNTMRISKENTISFIENFDGVSKVDLSIPKMDVQLLPFRYDNKLLFPYGNVSGWYSNVELRKALELGVVIKKVYRSYYCKENCRPFINFVNEMYELRKKYKLEGNTMQLVIKLLMNSLYGKFGQKFTDRDSWIPLNGLSELRKLEDYDIIDDFIRIKKDFTEPQDFCIPLWALYTTAYGRLKLYDYLIRSNPIYCDTDSIITKKHFESSNELGKLKLEHKIKRGIIVKPKFYGFIDSEDKEQIKIKGLGIRLNYKEFSDFLKSPNITYDKFMTWKEAIRRNFIPNEIQAITKNLLLEDNKREWFDLFDENILQKSAPILVE